MLLPDNTVTDRYPTRSADSRAPFERRDPTVWSASEGEEFKAFETDGFTVIESLLDPETVARYSAELDRLVVELHPCDRERTGVDDVSGDTRTIFGAHAMNASIDDLLRDRRIVEFVEQILDSEIYLLQSRANCSPGFDQTVSFWHSDFETWHAEDGMPAPRAVIVTIALTDNHAYNGAPMMMPGSHEIFVPCRSVAPARHHQGSTRDMRTGLPATEDIAELANRCGIAQFSGRAGSVLLRDANLMYATNANLTPFSRSSISAVFNSVHNVPVAPGEVKQRIPNLLGLRDGVAMTGAVPAGEGAR